MGHAVDDRRGVHDIGYVVIIMDSRLKRSILEFRVRSLRGHIAHLERLEYPGDSSGAKRELAKAESELQALGGGNEQR
jgi:hypothetical protein